MKTQLLCTFSKKSNLKETIDSIIHTYDNIVFNKIFILKDINSPLELICTYNIDITNGLPKQMLENTISLHRKKETDTLYTINALNSIVLLLNDGQADKTFPITWENYRNTLLLTGENGELRKINTELYEIVEIVSNSTIKNSS